MRPQVIAQALGGSALESICRTLASDYALWRHGLPDLLLWKPPQHYGGVGDRPIILDLRSYLCKGHMPVRSRPYHIFICQMCLMAWAGCLLVSRRPMCAVWR